MWKTLAAAAFVLLLAPAAAAQPTRACGYAMSACESYAAADAVFVGTVTRIVPATFRIDQTDSDYDQTAYVAVEKVYKGGRRARIVLRQLGRRDARKFVQNSRYLFYANYDRAARLWEVRPCGSTRMAGYAQDDLRYLDALPASAAGTRVSGEVMHFVTPDEEPEGGRLPGVRVRLFGDAGRVHETTTDAHGVYEFKGLPPGRYRIEVRAPADLVFYAAMHTGHDPVGRARALEFDLPEGGCAGLTILLRTAETIRPGDGGVGGLARPGAAASLVAPPPY